MFKRFFRRSTSAEGLSSSSSNSGSSSSNSLLGSRNRNRNSSAPQVNNATNNSSQHSPSNSRPKVNLPSRPNSQVVVLVNGELGKVVPLMAQLSLTHPAMPSTQLPFIPSTPSSDSDRMSYASSRNSAENTMKASEDTDMFYQQMLTLPRQYNTTLMSLPAELIIKIAHFAGFVASTKLMQASDRLGNILNTPSAWIRYTSDPSSSSDMIESEVTICTKIHTFDHLVFGLWDAPHSDGEPTVYFEHNAFSEEFDYLGGVNMALSRTGGITSEFFDHRETLACYKKALVDAVASGALPPSAPHGDPPAGAKIDHSCDECTRYSERRVLKSIFVFDQVPYHPKWGREGFSWVYEYPDNRRRLRISIKPFQGVTGYTSLRDLPSVYIKKVNVNGMELQGEEWDLFQRLVQRKTKKY